MMPWRKIAVVSVGASWMLGCTITTTDGGDGGVFQTGGASGTGGTTSVVGSTGGSTLGGASTVFVCDPSVETSDCGRCLQRADEAPDTNTDPGMCNEYKPCATTPGCTNIVNAMAVCMSAKAAAANVTSPPTGSDAACRAETAGMGATDTTAAAQAAQTLWSQINDSLWCGFPCWAENS